jgi:hypothetical protein
VPDWVRTVPMDPFDGTPIRFRPTPVGIVVYSIGPDGADDGGTIDPGKANRPGTDLGIRLWDVTQRTQLPRAADPPE